MSEETKKKRTRAEAARENGAKSRGPKTPEGKAKSSQNAYKHGGYSQAVILFHENREDYEALREAYFADLQPSSPLETTLVTEMVNAQWRIYRLQRTSSAIIDWSVEESEHEMNKQFGPNLDDDARHGFAWQQSVEESPALEVASRHEARLRRMHDRLFNNLLKLRELKKSRNEPVASPPAEEKPAQTQPAAAKPPASTPAARPSPPPYPFSRRTQSPANDNREHPTHPRAA